jgi:hypothetical protein
MAGSMRSVTDVFLQALRTSHQLALRVTAYPPSGDPFDVPINDGSVTLDRTADHRGRVDLVISDPSYYPDVETDPVNIYGTELNVQRGIDYGNGSVELVSLGWYRVQSIERDQPSTSGLAVSGWDRSQQVEDERSTQPRTIGPATYVAMIQDLVNDIFPSAVFHVTADSTTGTKQVLDRERWQSIQQFAAAIGYEVFVNADGEWVIQPVPDPTTATPVWTVDAGLTGVLVSVNDTIARDNVPNGVVAVGEAADGGTPAHALVTDDDASSPTLWGGAYGHVPAFYSSPFIHNNTQATKAATALLNDHKGAGRSVSFAAAPNPALEPDDCITLTYPDGRQVQHIIDTITIPLGVSGQITADTRSLEAISG